MKKKLYTFIGILIILTVALEAVNVYFANRIAAESVEASGLRAQIAKLDENNTQLSSQIVEHSSLDQIASRAATLGFVEGKNVMTLLAPLEVAIVNR